MDINMDTELIQLRWLLVKAHVQHDMLTTFAVLALVCKLLPAGKSTSSGTNPVHPAGTHMMVHTPHPARRHTRWEPGKACWLPGVCPASLDLMQHP
jgi:hypothetical protein